MATLLAICSFCCCFLVFVCLSLWCWGLDLDLIVSVIEFPYVLFVHFKMRNLSLKSVNVRSKIPFSWIVSNFTKKVYYFEDYDQFQNTTKCASVNHFLSLAIFILKKKKVSIGILKLHSKQSMPYNKYKS